MFSITGWWRQNRPMLVLNVVVVLVMTGMGMVIPIVPLYGRTFGASATMIGFLVTSFGLARMITDIPIGILLDRYGRRVILISGPLIIAVGSFLCGMAADYWQLVLWRFVQGVGSAMYTTAAMTVVADLSNEQNRGRNMAAYQASIFVGTGLGPALGGFLTGWLESYSAPFYAFGLLSLAGAAWVFMTLAETRPSGATAGAHGHSKEKLSAWFLLANLNFILVSLVYFGTFFARAGAKMDLIPMLGAEKVGLGPEQIGIALTLGAVATMAVLPVAGWAADRFGRKAVIVPANLITALSMALFAYCHDYLFFTGAILLYGVSTGFGGVVPAAYMVDIVPKHAYGSAMGMMRTFGDTGFVLGPVILGWLVDINGYPLAFWFLALMLGIISLAFGLFARECYVRTEKQ